VLVVAVHEGVFLGLPVIALELVGIGVVAGGPERRFQMIGQAGRDQAVRQGLTRRV